MDAIGLSTLSGAHMTLFPAVVNQLRDRDIGDIVVFGGGIVPEHDAELLKEGGMAAIFTPGYHPRRGYPMGRIQRPSPLSLSLRVLAIIPRIDTPRRSTRAPVFWHC